MNQIYDGLGLSLSLSLGPALGAELISNGGFETAGAGGADIWGTWTETASDGALANETTTVHSGTDACKITCGATTDHTATNVQSNAVAVTNGPTYRISFWCQGDGSDAPFYRLYGSVSGNLIAKVTTSVTAATWTRVTADYPSTEAENAYLILYAGETEDAVAYFDDVSVKAR